MFGAAGDVGLGLRLPPFLAVFQGLKNLVHPLAGNFEGVGDLLRGEGRIGPHEAFDAGTGVLVRHGLKHSRKIQVCRWKQNTRGRRRKTSPR